MDTLHGQGATPERKQKSNIVTSIRETTKGGIPSAYGDYDVEHCALDTLLLRGFIEKDHYDAGMNLRQLYYMHKSSAKSCCDIGGSGHDPDLETPSDRAYERHKKALQSISMEYRNLIQGVCCEDVQIPAMYGVSPEVVRGLEELIEFFDKKS